MTFERGMAMSGIYEWVIHHVSKDAVLTGDGRELHFNCPFCTDRRKRFYIQVFGDKGLCHCHNCGWNGNFTRLVYKTQGGSYDQAVETAKKVQGASYFEIRKTDDDDFDFADFVVSKLFVGMTRSPEKPHEPKKEIPLPESLIPVCGGCWSTYKFLQRDARQVLSSRGVTPEQARQHNIQICTDGKYQSRLIIPITNEGKTEFFVARSIYDWQKMKEYSPPKIDGGFKKSEVIFNLERAANTGTIVINEGIYDALAWGDFGISLLGKIMSDFQYQRIVEYADKIKQVFVCLDADARSYAIKIAKKLSAYFPVYLIIIPVIDGKPSQWDSNYYKLRFGDAGMSELVKNAVPYTLESEFRLLMSA